MGRGAACLALLALLAADARAAVGRSVSCPGVGSVAALKVTLPSPIQKGSGWVSANTSAQVAWGVVNRNDLLACHSNGGAAVVACVYQPANISRTFVYTQAFPRCQCSKVDKKLGVVSLVCS